MQAICKHTLVDTKIFPQHPALNNLYLRIQRMSWQLYFNIVYEIKESRGWFLQHFLKALSSYLGPEAGYPDVRICGFPPSL